MEPYETQIVFKIIATEYRHYPNKIESIPGNRVAIDIDFGDPTDRKTIEIVCYDAITQLQDELLKLKEGDE